MRTRLPVASCGVALALALAAPPAGAAIWQDARDLGRVATPDDAVARVALDADGHASVAWSEAFVTHLRDVSPSGRPGRVAALRGHRLDAVARDGDGRVLIAGARSRGRTMTAWAAVRRGTTLAPRTLGSGALAGVEFAAGDARGFTLAVSTFRRTGPGGKADDRLRRARVTADGRVILGSASQRLFARSGEFAGDASNWTRAADGTPLGLVAVPDPDEAFSIRPALARLTATPAVTDLGDQAVEEGALDRSAGTLAAAGLAVDRRGDAGARGRVRTTLGDEAALGSSRLVPGVPPRRALEVDVAALPDGGAVVTWLQKVDTGGFSRLGRPHWARLAPDGAVTAQGRLDAMNARNLRVVRTGRGAVAVWIRSEGPASRFRAARLGGPRPLPLSAPDGTPVGRVFATTSQQVVSSGSRVAVAYVDARAKRVRVAIRRVPEM